MTLDGKTPEEQSKIVQLKIKHSVATDAPDIQKPKTVNPLDLPYFMVATIGTVPHIMDYLVTSIIYF